ncbi:MAG: sterol carrier family protein [Pseudolysinimonas sp.]|uniref:sterol carrier family protein n=1 Tax=Pseudolysinimonas sp. TaxID=2680009 RepID=UPI003C7883EB
MRRRIAAVDGVPAVRAILAGADDRTAIALATRYLLEQLADEAEGHTVEVRVPPFGAVQAIPGPRHTRGTPPNVVEMDAATWIALATGALAWDAALAELRVTASGQRATLAEHLPLTWETMEP